ncbi:hypothetical protein OUZ56_031062 [Daphnia magna]|uniref:Uncharacterized protein n=1 Tax=Daphnia magna TaxID=35525 RepID=A0ABQ9ZUC9_9CRUS|nr:hypothetical protein OUZ56_031062 [Daphnia magna]
MERPDEDRPFSNAPMNGQQYIRVLLNEFKQIYSRPKTCGARASSYWWEGIASVFRRMSNS